jgi:hypothetical protein
VTTNAIETGKNGYGHPKGNILTLSHNMAQETTIASGFTGRSIGQLHDLCFQRCVWVCIGQMTEVSGSDRGWENGQDEQYSHDGFLHCVRV